jgi:uncharacterized RDD family membrane protein YckC
MPVIQIATPFNIDIEFELAPFPKRLLAYFIDFIIIILYLISMLYLLFGGFNPRGDAIGLVLLVLFLPTLLYTMLCELLLNGQTIGKKVMQIKVVSLDGGEPSLGQYMLRWFLRFYEWGFIIFSLFWGGFGTGLTFLIFGGLTSVVIMAISKKNQRLGDIAAGTVVVNTKSKLTAEDTIFINISQPNYKVTFPEVMRLSDRDINTIKNVLTQARKHKRYDMCNRVAFKVQDVLQVSSDMYAMEFLEKIMEDYNYLSTAENSVVKN